MDRKAFLIIAIATFITISLWVFFAILHTRASVEVSSNLQQVITPLNPNFDDGAIQLLK